MTRRLTPKKRGKGSTGPAPDWKAGFLATLRVSPNVAAAAEAAGLSRQAAYKARESDPEFADAWDDAIESAVDRLVGRAWQRAELESDVLAIFLLKSHRPATYNQPTRMHHAGDARPTDLAVSDPAGGPIPDHDDRHDPPESDPIADDPA